MDYRYYQGDPFIKNLELKRKLVVWLKPVGITMCALSLIFPMLMILHLMKSTFFLNCLVYTFQFWGVVLWVYGHSLKKVSMMDDEELSQEILDYYNQKRKKIE